MQFKPPSSEQPLARAGQANDLVREALDRLVAEANAVGWGTDEIIVAIADNASKLKEANVRDPDPAEDPAISDISPNASR